MEKNTRALTEQATELLKNAGYKWDGTRPKTGEYQQFLFEKRMVKTGFRGASRRPKPK